MFYYTIKRHIGGKVDEDLLPRYSHRSRRIAGRAPRRRRTPRRPTLVEDGAAMHDLGSAPEITARLPAVT